MKLLECKCKRCGKSWTPRKPPAEIVQCPRCTSRLWNVSRREVSNEKTK